MVIKNAEHGLIRGLLHPQRAQRLIDPPNRLTQLPAGMGNDDPIVHKTRIKQLQSLVSLDNMVFPFYSNTQEDVVDIRKQSLVPFSPER